MVNKPAEEPQPGDVPIERTVYDREEQTEVTEVVAGKPKSSPKKK